MLKNATSKVMWLGRAPVWMVGIALLAGLVTGGLLAPPAYAASITFTVNSTADTGDATPDGACNSPCTLREAIQEANANNNPSEVDKIVFGIPSNTDPNCNVTTKVCTISPGSELPTVNEPVIINGYYQPDSLVNTLAKGTNAVLKVELNGTNAGGTASGLSIGAKNSLVRGLAINRFARFGINFLGSASGSKAQGNFIGTDPSGTLDEGNLGLGLAISTSNVLVGGTTPDKRNLISGNQASGVQMFGFGIEGNNKVQGNLIGTDKNGTANLGNSSCGIFVINGLNNVIGGSTAAANTIAFNGAEGSSLNGSDGVAIFGDSSTGNRILTNSIFSNVGLGVDLIGPSESVLTDVSPQRRSRRRLWPQQPAEQAFHRLGQDRLWHDHHKGQPEQHG